MDFKLPDIGEGVHEGEIVKWLVKEGDAIKEDQPMVEVMTDKATVEIPSPVNGTVESLLFPEGKTVEVGKVIIKIAEGGKASAAAPKKEEPKAKEEKAAAPAPAKKVEAAKAPKEEPEAPAEEDEEETESAEEAPQKKTVKQVKQIETSHEVEEDIPFTVLATPATRKLSRDLGVNLREVKGTGIQGRISKEDVQLAYEGRQAATPRSSHSGVTSSSLVPKGSFAPSSKVEAPSRGSLQRIPLKGIRKKIAEAMTRSKHTAAHFTYVEECDMSAIVKLRKSALPEAEKRGVKLTFLPFIIKSLIPALQEFPFLNSSLDDEKEEIVLKGDYNIGIATDTDNGLIVPVIKNADKKTIWELAEEIHTLSEKARIGKLGLEDLKGGTFTITNAGSIGGVFATPIINHPEVAILGVNAIRKRPIVKNDEITIGEMMFLSLSVDHRVVDGADAARFMNRLVYFLSEPQRLVFA